MQRVHFIAIGGAAMHNLAIAVSRKENIKVTGSDEEISEPALSKLKQYKLLPEKSGWFPAKIEKGLNAVIIGESVTKDNPELIRAKELSLKIYSMPEFLFQQTRSKTRIVVSGSYGKSTTTAMILFVLKQNKIDTDYMLGTKFEGFENMVKLTYEARIAVFEGDEAQTSPINLSPKFHQYKPHIAILTGIEWDQNNNYPNFESYVEQFRKFAELMEMQGRLIYYEGDENLKKIAEKIRRDMVSFPYNIPDYEIINGITHLKTKKGLVPLKIFGEYNLQNIEAARYACRQIGVYDDQFYRAIAEFPGIANNLQKISETENTVVFKDAAQLPSKIKAAIHAVKTQFPDKKLITCIELHTFENLTNDFLPHYTGCLNESDLGFIYYNQEVIENKLQTELSPEKIESAFGNKKNIAIFTDTQELDKALKGLDFKSTSLLILTPKNFLEISPEEFARELLTK